LERQLLAAGEISGYTRLHIFSFDRLAQFIFEQLHVAPPKLLSAEGRLMVLRALLRRHEGELKLFRGSARRAGFAQELGTLLAELQQHQFTPAKLRPLAENEKLPRELRDKLHDLALLLEKYSGWLADHELQDANHLLDFATTALREATAFDASRFTLHGLWLDGFAEMTPQELALLAAVVPRCERATLAFCLETEPLPEASWLSIWSAIGKTFQECRTQIANQPGCEVTTEILPRDPAKNRFAENSALATLELNWSLPVMPEFESANLKAQISVTACANAEAEAIFAAREVLKFVRAGNRFHDCAVLVRQLDGYHQPLARAFRRYGLPFFLDRRENITHHPLAELTRNALRTVAFDWQQDDWFAALKAGFSPGAETELDRLENAALEAGWRGPKWREPLPDETSERLREIIFPPFETLANKLIRLNHQPNGVQLAEAIRKLWADLKVEQILTGWTLVEEKSAIGNRQSAIHATVWEQMNAWLDNVALAFPNEPMPLRDWLPVLEAGLANLTVGVIPPVLDEVLIGAIDRARNPSLKFALILGVNEAIFPAAPSAPVILTNSDRDELERQNVSLGARLFDQISRERYLGYIACTRANDRLAITFARQGAAGQTLNPSTFIGQLQRIFPTLVTAEITGSQAWSEAEHACELVKSIVARQRDVSLPAPAWLEIPVVKSLAENLARLREPAETENLSPALADKLYGPVLRSSVSRLEELAQCPFKFFIRSGLHANERKVFELDARERGNFQHDVLKIFHEQLQLAGQRWRDLSPLQARERIGKIATTQIESFNRGLLRDSAETTFTARSLAAALQDFVEVMVGWLHTQNDFDPAAAEIGFGGQADRTPAWEIELGGGRKLALQGRIDRVDLWRDPARDTALAVVTDYKSGGKKLESLLVENGVQLQLLAYLGALQQWPNPTACFGVQQLMPAGAFYVNLRGDFKSGGSRAEVLGDPEAKKLAYRHNGRFDASALRKFDRRPNVSKGDQFNFRLNKDGGLPSNSAEALPRENFLALVADVADKLRELGQQIFSGAAAVDPYRKGTQTPCEYCDYRAGCRIDEWTHEWRVLRPPEPKAST
jgi:ATP-dependent helicase/nuclease subunit B